jgi:hypothetical protein
MILFFEEMDELEYKLQGSRLVEIQLFPSTTWSRQSTKELGLRNHVQVHYNFIISPWLPRINQCVPSTPEYVTLINNILTCKFSWIYFWPTPSIKLKLPMRISETLLISTHLDQSTYPANQQQVLGSEVNLTSFQSILCKTAGPKRKFAEINQRVLTFLYSINFLCRATYWAPVELLSCPTLRLKIKYSKTLFTITLILVTFFFVTHFF